MAVKLVRHLRLKKSHNLGFVQFAAHKLDKFSDGFQIIEDNSYELCHTLFCLGQGLDVYAEGRKMSS